MKNIFKSSNKNLFWLVITLIFITCFSTASWHFRWGWTGFNSYVVETETNGSKTVETHPGKTLWDVLDLIIIPVALGLGAFFLNRAQSQNELLRVTIQQQEELLQAYIDAMTQLILEKGLKHPTENSEKYADLCNVARSRTLTVLGALDTPNADGNNRRRASLARFLYEAQLINSDRPIISLQKATLGEAYMRGYYLREVNFQGVSLYKADLRDADLKEADLRGAYLVKARLQGADLTGAKLDGATLEGAFWGKYVNTHTKWPDGFDYTKAKVQKEDITTSRDWSKNISSAS
ncbi:MAG: pentapeptide repeat-containing protein [Leptolyngbya sp. SIO1D8]|nr:pentapeptide repeat-containing protein [Leptolyngbya sp. SIO1D8]